MTTPMKDFDLKDPAAYAAPVAECDLIMKGGITSGLVYPLAACRLATRYRFRQVGGASAGAIAAALTAAAEYQRRTGVQPRTSTGEDIDQVGREEAALRQAQGLGGEAPVGRAEGLSGQTANQSATGFLALAGIPGLMGERLASLFQPSAALRGPYDVLTSLVEPGWSRGTKVAAVIGIALRSAPLAFVGVGLAVLVLVTLPVWFGVPVWAAVLNVAFGVVLALVLGLVAAAWSLVRTTLARLPANGYGVCTGLAEPGSTQPPPLTDWLTAKLDEVAGLAPDAGPLTFGHLFGEAASAAFRELHLDEDSAPENPARLAAFAPELDLQMMTTCLTFQRPYVFPFRTKSFHFCPECWRAYFPAKVLDQLVRTSRLPSPKTQRADGRDVPIDQFCTRHPGTPVRRLPAAPDIPVVVGVRLSLSFPGLISAVPCQTIDFSRAPGKQGMIEVWFSDGGIASNFPIHFFDTLWPGRPTFGINLAEEHPDYPGQMTWRAKGNAPGIVQRQHPITSMVGFLGAVVGTMHNWVDNMAVPAPGFRDRVVELRTTPDEGGLNLKMAKPTITALGLRGDEAAQQFEDFDFENHCWIRYRTSMVGLAEALWGMERVYPAYRPLIEHGVGRAYRFHSDEERDAAGRVAALAETDELVGVATRWGEDDYAVTKGSVPHPRAVLRSVMRQ